MPGLAITDYQDRPVESGTQFAIAVPTGSSAAIHASLACREVVLSSPPANTKTVYVGFSGLTVANGTPLAPGERIGFRVNNVAVLFSISGDAAQELRALVDVSP